MNRVRAGLYGFLVVGALVLAFGGLSVVFAANAAPVFDAAPPAEVLVTVGGTTSFIITASYPDLQALISLSVENKPSGSTFSMNGSSTNAGLVYL